MTDKVQKIKDWISKEQDGLMDAKGNFEYPEHEGAYHILCNLDTFIDSLQEEPVSEELEEAADNFVKSYTKGGTKQSWLKEGYMAGAKWQKQQDQFIIELAEDHAYFAGRTKTINEINKALLSEVLPYFMHGGESDEVVAKLDEVLNNK